MTVTVHIEYYIKTCNGGCLNVLINHKRMQITLLKRHFQCGVNDKLYSYVYFLLLVIKNADYLEQDVKSSQNIIRIELERIKIFE